MCGLVGILGAYTNGFTNKEQAIFRDMLVIDTVRGYDGTGVFAVTNSGDVDTLKAAKVGGEFVTQKEYVAFNNTLNTSGIFAVGHNRWATKGSITDDNCHPFVVNDEIVLVQNGTMYESHHHIAKVDVDSHAIAHLLQKETDVTKALNSINAAYALIWYDVRTKTLNFIRNDERPLWFCKTNDDSVLFASEPWMMTALVARHDAKIKEAPWQLKEHVLLQYKLDPINHKYESSHEALKISAPIPVVYSYSTTSYQTDNAKSQDNLPIVKYKDSKEAMEIPTGETIFANNWDKGLDEAKAKEFAEDFTGAYKANGTLNKFKKIVEVYDVCPANKHADCTTWHVLALELAPDYENDFRVWYHWLVYNQTKAQMASYVKDGIFEVECCPVYTTSKTAAGSTRFINISYCVNATQAVLQ